MSGDAAGLEDLDRRIRRLEREREVAAKTRAYGALVDDGPYDADKLIEDWAPDGVFDTGSGVFRGRDEIHRFFADLAAKYTIHYSSNLLVDLDDSLESADVRSYGLEGPVIAGQALVGGFRHRARTRLAGGRWEWTDRQQTMYFLSPAPNGWDGSSRIVEQRSSRGADQPPNTDSGAAAPSNESESQ